MTETHCPTCGRAYRRGISHQQRKYVRWVSKFIAIEYSGCDHHEYQEHAREVHYKLLAAYWGVKQVGDLVLPKKTTSDMTSAEMTEYIDWLPRYCAQAFDGFLVPLPNEVDPNELEG